MSPRGSCCSWVALFDFHSHGIPMASPAAGGSGRPWLGSTHWYHEWVEGGSPTGSSHCPWQEQPGQQGQGAALAQPLLSPVIGTEGLLNAAVKAAG